MSESENLRETLQRALRAVEVGAPGAMDQLLSAVYAGAKHLVDDERQQKGVVSKDTMKQYRRVSAAHARASKKVGPAVGREGMGRLRTPEQKAALVETARKLAYEFAMLEQASNSPD